MTWLSLKDGFSKRNIIRIEKFSFSAIIIIYDKLVWNKFVFKRIFKGKTVLNDIILTFLFYISTRTPTTGIESNLVNFDCVLFNTERDIQKFMSDFASSNFELHFSLEPTTEPCKNNPFLSTGSNIIINFLSSH